MSKSTKIAIIGGTKSWVDAPFDDQTWEIWVIGNQIGQYEGKRIDLIFEIHNDFSNRPEGYSAQLASMGHPMVVGNGFGHKGDAIEVFDFDKAKALMRGDYLTSTPSYQTAYALYARPDVEEIGYWGIDMAIDDGEYFYEQPCIQRWIGFCEGRGIKITLPDGCPLGEPNYIEGVTSNNPRTPYSEKDFRDLSARHQVLLDEVEEKIVVLRLRLAQQNACVQIYDKLAQVGRATDAGQQFDSLAQTLRTIKNEI